MRGAVRFPEPSKLRTFATLLNVLRASHRFDRSSRQAQTKLLLPFSDSRTPRRWATKNRPKPAFPKGSYSLLIAYRSSELDITVYCNHSIYSLVQ